MDKNSIIKSVKRQDEEKVAFSLKLPASLKDQLQEISEKESISMNALIVAALNSFIDDDCGVTIRKLKSLLMRAKEYVDFDDEATFAQLTSYEDQQQFQKHYDLCQEINNVFIN
ncbi:MAG: hypothetical protein Q8R58_02250 [Sulfuricurvum sp.]|nr:hypothetical protein [Sulfuricurvum sp.]